MTKNEALKMLRLTSLKCDARDLNDSILRKISQRNLIKCVENTKKIDAKLELRIKIFCNAGA